MKAAIFDLDNCLCPATAAGQGLFAPAFEAIRRANRGAVDEQTLERALGECWYTAFDLVAQLHGFSQEMAAAGREAFARLEIAEPIEGYADLHLVQRLPLRRFLVTSGFRRLQQSKIERLKLEPCFEGIFIDAIDEPGHPGKQHLFERILESAQCAPCDVLVIGDNPLSELLAGRNLGMVTVQTLRPGIKKSPVADHHVESFQELWPLCGFTPLPGAKLHEG